MRLGTYVHNLSFLFRTTPIAAYTAYFLAFRPVYIPSFSFFKQIPLLNIPCHRCRRLKAPNTRRKRLAVIPSLQTNGTIRFPLKRSRPECIYWNRFLTRKFLHVLFPTVSVTHSVPDKCASRQEVLTSHATDGLCGPKNVGAETMSNRLRLRSMGLQSCWYLRTLKINSCWK